VILKNKSISKILKNFNIKTISLRPSKKINKDMKLKGMEWFFAIVLILISVYQLSFTWVVNSHENKMKAKAVKFVSQAHPGISGDEKDHLVRETFHHYLDSTRD
jgi:hypothetical protein